MLNDCLAERFFYTYDGSSVFTSSFFVTFLLVVCGFAIFHYIFTVFHEFSLKKALLDTNKTRLLTYTCFTTQLPFNTHTLESWIIPELACVVYGFVYVSFCIGRFWYWKKKFKVVLFCFIHYFYERSAFIRMNISEISCSVLSMLLLLYLSFLESNWKLFIQCITKALWSEV